MSLCLSTLLAGCSAPRDAHGPVTKFQFPCEEKIVQAKLRETAKTISEPKKSQTTTVPADAAAHLNDWEEYAKAKISQLSSKPSGGSSEFDRASALMQEEALRMLTAMPKARRNQIVSDDLADHLTLERIESIDQLRFYTAVENQAVLQENDQLENIKNASKLHVDAIEFDQAVIDKVLPQVKDDMREAYQERIHRIEAESVWQEFALVATSLQASDTNDLENLIDKAVKMKPFLPQGETKELQELRQNGMEAADLLRKDHAHHGAPN